VALQFPDLASVGRAAEERRRAAGLGRKLKLALAVIVTYSFTPSSAGGVLIELVEG